MLLHHFKAETQGFQGLGDQNDCGKAKVPEKSHLLKEIFLRGSRGENLGESRPQVFQVIS